LRKPPIDKAAAIEAHLLIGLSLSPFGHISSLEKPGHAWINTVCW
jgi:hypothetical protein